jgi:NADH dehydrogenase
MLEQADVEHGDANLKNRLITLVVARGGFSGVETVGELNDFVRESIKHFYHNLDPKDARVILVNAGQRILPEVSDDLAAFVLQKLKGNGVEVILNTRLVGATREGVRLNDGSVIPSNTII